MSEDEEVYIICPTFKPGADDTACRNNCLNSQLKINSELDFHRNLPSEMRNKQRETQVKMIMTKQTSNKNAEAERRRLEQKEKTESIMKKLKEIE